MALSVVFTHGENRCKLGLFNIENVFCVSKFTSLERLSRLCKPLLNLQRGWYSLNQGSLTVDLLVLTGLDQLLFILKILFTSFTKQPTLMRRSNVILRYLGFGCELFYCIYLWLGVNGFIVYIYGLGVIVLL